MIQQSTFPGVFAIRRVARLRVLGQAVAVYVVCFCVCAALLFATPGFVGIDDYYHAGVSAQIIEQGQLALHFPWLPLTILNAQQFVDHHLLFHLYLSIWVVLGGIAGAKLGTLTIAAGVGVTLWLVLRKIDVRQPLAWTLLLFGLSTPFLLRLLMIRTQGAALLFLLLALLAMFSGKHRWLIPLSFAFVWLYDGFALLLIFTVAYAAARWIAERELAWQPVVYCVIGLGLGLVINPYFPTNLQFVAEHLGAKVDFESGIQVGNEWYPYTTGALMANSAGALLVLGIAVVRHRFAERGPREAIDGTLLFVAVITLLMVFRSRRFIEYYPPFALLFCAATWGRGENMPLDVVAHLLPAWIPTRTGRVLTMLAIGLAASLLIGLTLRGAFVDIQDSTSPNYMAGAAHWLRDNTPAGAPVFQTDWDDFPYLFYHNTHNVYLVGLDPTYFERVDPGLWELWVDITRGDVDHPSDVILSEFGMKYVVSDTKHKGFERVASNDPGMVLVYQDETSLVWRIEDTH